MGVDYVEIDVRRTSDGVYVNFHDDRTPSDHEIHVLTYAALKRELGAELLTIDEVIGLVDGKVGLHVDLKEEGQELDVVRYIEARCTHSEAVFTTGGDVAVRAIKDQIPHARAGLTLGEDLEGAPPWRALSVRLSELFPGPRLRRSRADFTAVHKRLAEVRVLDYCARRHTPAWVWTVDDEVEIARLMRDPRVTVLITNRPDIAMRFRTA